MEHLTVTTLAREQFDEWDTLVSASPHGTVFHYSWWLEATGSELKILGCWDEDGNLIGGMPLPFKRRARLKLYHSPRLTPYLGPIFDLSALKKNADRLSLMRHGGEQLAQAIQGFDLLSYTAGAAGPDLQGFLWAGFRVHLTYTFRIEAGTTVDEASQQISRRHKENLKKNAQYMIKAGDDVGALSALSGQTFERQGMKSPFSENYLRRLWEEISKQGAGVIYTAHDLQGRAAAALLVVHDPRTSTQLVSGIDMNLRGSPAGVLLTWRAIRDALDAGRAFDFEGSRIRGVEQYYRRWGAQAYPVWQLSRTGSMRGVVAKFILDLLHSEEKPRE